MGKQFL